MSIDSSALRDLTHFLQKHWFDKTGLAAALIVAAFVTESLLVGASAIWWLNILILTLVLSSTAIAWWLSGRSPKTPQGKVGFLVSITCDDDAESTRLREDFLMPLQKLIKSGASGKAFHFMQLPPHLARRIIDQDQAQLARIRSGAHFMLYGQIRLRTIDGMEHHVINLDGLVAVNAIPDHVMQRLVSEFSELLPRKVHIPIENDLFSFQFTSEWADIVAKYIIGIAAALSGDVAYAESLYTDAQQRLNYKDKSFPVYQKLAVRLPDRISELHEARANDAYRAWAKDHDHSHIDDLRSHLDKVLDTVPRALHLRAILAFLDGRDVEAAIGYLKKIKDSNNGLWHYNMAFLYGYQGNLKVAARHYREGALHVIEPDQIGQVEDFICWVLQQEPDKYQLSYCLGLFNWKTKGDREQARSDFAAFLSRAEGDCFTKEQELATKWIADLNE